MDGERVVGPASFSHRSSQTCWGGNGGKAKAAVSDYYKMILGLKEEFKGFRAKLVQQDQFGPGFPWGFRPVQAQLGHDGASTCCSHPPQGFQTPL